MHAVSPPSLNPVTILSTARNVAIVGASNDSAKPSGRAQTLLSRYGFSGRVFLVNPHRKNSQGEHAYPAIDSIPEKIDVAIIALPAGAMEKAIRDCGRAEIPLAIVFASGYAETGETGVMKQQALLRTAQSAGVRLLGPNCLGAVIAKTGLTATFMTGLDQDCIDLRNDGIAMASQSGAIGAALFTTAYREGLGIGSFLSSGNEADVEMGELIEGMASQPDTRVIISYIEGLRRDSTFEKALVSARSAGKPVAVLKVGRTSRGGQAAASHTGALAGSDRAFEGLLDRHGVPRAYDLEQLIDLARIFSAGKVAGGKRVTIVTISGGAGILATDAAENLGLDVFEWDPDWQAQIAAELPRYASMRNPIDTTASIVADLGMLEKAVQVAVANPSTDVAVVLVANLNAHEDAVSSGLAKVADQTEKPLVVAWPGGSEERRRWLSARGVPSYTDPVRAIRAVAGLVKWSTASITELRHNRETHNLAEKLPRPRGGTALNEVLSKELIESYGIRAPARRVARSIEEAVILSRKIGYPVVLKILSEKIMHKADANAIRLGLASPDEVAIAATELEYIGSMLDLTDAQLLVEKQMNVGTELLLGMSQDPTFGPLTVVGVGGTLAEVIDDVVIRPSPVSAEEAGDMLKQMRAASLLSGFRGRPPANLAALTQVIASFSSRTANYDTEVQSIEINPLGIDDYGEPIALDALVTFRTQHEGESQ